ncbi:LOW QUALITY PROTEIN: spatacsin [Xenentodon cancila]
MLDAEKRLDGASMEVIVVPEDQRCGAVWDIQKAELSPAGSLLACLRLGGRLEAWAPADRDTPVAAAEGTFVDFCWEEVRPSTQAVGRFRLLAVRPQGNLLLLEAEAERAAGCSLLCVSETPADHLIHAVQDQDQSVSELQSVQVLSFVAGRCVVLLNSECLLQLQWQQSDHKARMASVCRLQLSGDRPAVHHSLSAESLFVLRDSGLVFVHHLSDGSLLATIDLPTYLSSSEDALTPYPLSSSLSFCMFQVSADLSTAVAVTQCHTAVAVDLNHYFRVYPDHLVCATPQPHPPVRPVDIVDQDSLSSSVCCLAAVGSSFREDRSWEARLASIYNSVQQSSPSSSSSTTSSLWCSSLPHYKSNMAPASAHSRAPPGGAFVGFSVPESSAASLLTVSEFSALLTFVTPGNRRTLVAFWQMESGSVSYHQTEGEAAAVQMCGERQHRLLLKKAGIVQVLFSVSQQDLLSRLMLFGSAATVDAVCHLNSWGHCSIPIHSLQAGLKNRQLDTVDFYLKSKENVLIPSLAFTGADQPSDSTLIDGVEDLCPALDLLCSSVRESSCDAQSRQFSEQLLNITVSFVNTQIRSLLSSPHNEDPDVHSCVNVLDRYIAELRSYMKNFPWSPASSPSSSAGARQGQEDSHQDDWQQLSPEEVVKQSILTSQIPKAQALLRKGSLPGHHLADLRMEGLRQVFSCLQCRDLQTASTLLSNMGLNVKKQLHSICLYTSDKDLRELMVEELSNGSSFSEEEMQSVVFIRKMEKLGLLPAFRGPAPTSPLRFVRMVPKEVDSEGLLKEALDSSRPEEGGGLWRNVRLDWVRNWDQSCRTAILLSRHQHLELSCVEPSVLWRYLTGLHHLHWVVDWIQGKESCWPEITPELVNDNTVCSTPMKENILDLLARRGLFIPEERSDLEQLLWRLAQGGGLLASAPPVPQYRSPLGLDLHSAFIMFCLDHDIQYLLYTYLEHYRLTPRNCRLLTDPNPSASRPWFEMLVKIQEITRDLSDPGLVFQASLTSAQVLLPGSQASLNSLLLEGHSLLALATLMFAPEGIDQVMAKGRRSERTVDPQLLKMALAPYPKLKVALFPAGPCGYGPSSDISIYHLLQSLHPLDPSRLFGWQTANTVNSTETSELLHFCSPHLVSRFALVENLDFLYYIHHGRPSFAFGNFLLQQLSSCTDMKLMLQRAWEQLYRLVLQCFNEPPVMSAAVCFCELLGLSSLKLRVDIRAMNSILQHWNQDGMRVPAQNLRSLVSKGLKLVEGEPGAAEELIGYLEAAVTDSLEQRGVSRWSYEAALEWALPVHFCQLHSLNLSSVYPLHCAQDRQLIYFLLFVQLHHFPPQQVRSLVSEFGPTLQAHLTLAFQDLQVCRQRRAHDLLDQLGSGRAEKAPGSLDHPRELFLVLLQSQEKAVPCRYLLHEALVQRCPVLAILAASLQGSEPLSCLCVWVLTTIDDVTAAEASAHLAEAPEHHDWTLHDLSVIWRTLLGHGYVRPLLQGFQLFQRDSPLLLVLTMFELCCDYRKFSEAKSKLLDFQKMLITLRNGGPAPSGGPPLQWVESQASVLLLTMLQRCSSQYDLHRLLLLLADVDKLLKSNGPDFRKLSHLSQLLQGSGVRLSPRLLQCSSTSVQQEELQLTVDALQAKGHYSQARQVAQLADLPVHHLLLSQLSQEVSSQKTKQQWRRLESRVSFWRRCHQQLEDDGTDPQSAAGFFLSQAEPRNGAQAQIEVLDVQEHILLLLLGGRWLSLLSPAPLDQIENLEKQLWLCNVHQHLLTTAIEKESVFNLPPATLPDVNLYVEFMKDFSFSNIAELNKDVYLSLDGLPGPSGELDVVAELSPEEWRVLFSLVGQLLDEGSIYEASRVCRYFSLHHPDMWIVLRCRGLASGNLSPELQDATADAPARKTIISSPSLSSLSSLVMVSLPEDPIFVELQKIVDQCHHGNNYCKQILSLYQLSKELQCSFSQICGEDHHLVLQKLLLSDQPERFRKARAFIRAQGLFSDSVAELVSSAVVQGLLASNPELQAGEKQVFRPSEGRDSLLQLVRLCDDPSLVGLKLMENLNSVPLRDLSCIVELLIVAHDCFSLTCNMEGIVRVLQAARHLSHAYLAPGEHHSLLVRLLTGIGRYNEMTYIFDLLHQNHCFEMLLRKKVDSDRGQSSSLKTALLDYIKRCLPADSEKHNMVALCFSMRREIGENHEIAARTQLKMIESQAWVVTPELKTSLVKDSCVRQASRCVRTAKLVALQLHFLNQGSDLRIINLRPAELLKAIVALPRCYQVFVMSEAYGHSPDWAEILYQRVVLKGDCVLPGGAEAPPARYLHLCLRTSSKSKMIAELGGASGSVAANVKRLLIHCEDVYIRYKLAYQQNLYDVTKTLLQEPQTSNYLNDRLSQLTEPDELPSLSQEVSSQKTKQSGGDWRAVCPSGGGELDVVAELSPEEWRVLFSLVGQLLDEGSIYEASRVCRYFSLHHPDMWIVLRCRGLASGNLSPELQDATADAPARKTIISSPSLSSLSSLVMVSLPEDPIFVELQKIVDQCHHGNNYCKQILSTSSQRAIPPFLNKVKSELQCSFSQICGEDHHLVLQKLLLSDQPERFRKARAFIRAQGLFSDSVAELVSSAVVQGLLASNPELQAGEKQVFRPSEGRDSLLQLVRLCDDPSLVGLKLMENLNSVPLRDLSCIVELLIVAHDCFSLTCNMEGIVRVLQAARHLSHAYLAPGEHHSLLVRLLTGIGRYNEMTYIFDLLHQNHCFEMLLRKKVDSDRGQSSSLKTALLDYIKRCLPADSEKQMVALCFSMRREIGENHEIAARTQLKMIESQAWVVTPELKTSLVKVLALLKDAAESFSKDSCVRQASRCVRTAKLVALQLHFLNQGSDLRIINLRPAELLKAIVALPRCYQVFVMSEAYGHSPDWAEILYQRVVLKGDFVYLEELKRHRPLTCTLFEDIFKKLGGASGSVAANVKRLLIHCEDVYIRYKLAYQQNLYDVTKTLLQEPQTSNYLNDRLSS